FGLGGVAGLAIDASGRLAGAGDAGFEDDVLSAAGALQGRRGGDQELRAAAAAGPARARERVRQRVYPATSPTNGSDRHGYGSLNSYGIVPVVCGRASKFCSATAAAETANRHCTYRARRVRVAAGAGALQ